MEECRAPARHGLTRCRWHSFTRLQSRLRALRASAADTLEECPYRGYHEYVARDAHGGDSLALRFGSAYHELAEALLREYWAGADDLLTLQARERVGAIAARYALPATGRWGREELESLHERFRVPCDREALVFVEPCARAGDQAEPAVYFQPLRVGDLDVWGTPDCVFADQDGVTIVDWKTGQQPEDPGGWAAAIYPALCEVNWPAEQPYQFTWPVRLVWRFSRLGEHVATRERLVYREEALGRLHVLAGMAREWREQLVYVDHFAAIPNEHCAWCPLLDECPAPRSAQWPEDLAGQYLRAVALEAHWKQEATRLRGPLVARVAAGEDVTDPWAGGRMFTVSPKVAYGGRSLGQDGLRKAREVGGEYWRALKTSPTGDRAIDDALVAAGLMERRETLDIRRARNGAVVGTAAREMEVVLRG
jgi:hypothetical protein